MNLLNSFLWEQLMMMFLCISTYLWDRLPGDRFLQDYILFMLGTSLLANYANLPFDTNTVGCIFDYCDDPIDIDKAFKTGNLCNWHQSVLESKITSGSMTLPQYAATMRLINRGRGTKTCFIVMPFRQSLDRVYKNAIKPVLEANGWNVIRADENVFPRIITRAITLNILSADLVIADLTGLNPNVFYEIGVSEAVGTDMIFLIQEGQELPFDVRQRRTIFYKATGYKKLARDLKHLAGLGSY